MNFPVEDYHVLRLELSDLHDNKRTYTWQAQESFPLLNVSDQFLRL